jgi:hypothetical protein
MARAPEALAPRRAPLDDRRCRGDLAFEADMVAHVLRHPHGTPPLHRCDNELRQGHPITRR